MTDPRMDIDTPLLHLCYAPVDRGWVHGRMVRELGLRRCQYRTRDDDRCELRVQSIARAVAQCRFTAVVTSAAARWDPLARLAAELAQHAGRDGQPRLIVISREPRPVATAQPMRLPRALVRLDCSDEASTAEAMLRLRVLLALDERSSCCSPRSEGAPHCAAFPRPLETSEPPPHVGSSDVRRKGSIDALALLDDIVRHNSLRFRRKRRPGRFCKRYTRHGSR